MANIIIGLRAKARAERAQSAAHEYEEREHSAQQRELQKTDEKFERLYYSQEVHVKHEKLAEKLEAQGVSDESGEFGQADCRPASA